MMRRHASVLLVAVGIGVAAGLPYALTAARKSPTAPEAAGTVTVQDRYGVVRYDTAKHRWVVAGESPLRGSGLTGVSCSTTTGKLTVSFTPLSTIGTFTVDEDDVYAGRYAAGATVTTKSLTITVRKVSSGAVVSCNSTQLRLAGSSLQVWVRGSVVSTSPPTTAPTPPAPSPTRPSTSPTALPPTTVTAPPPITDSDPPDSAVG
ncbi:hypothetical protein [Nucisporomicrobium flavum]|uniref:hypothetical protein n=1 Tax=Nucisporomicrobium flavum TaxID=2785915 RepID=UPI0018F33653|nr:hypothetical protein [Nucisporomicrobium flavum]